MQLKCDAPVSNFAHNFNSRRYTEDAAKMAKALARKAAVEAGEEDEDEDEDEETKEASAEASAAQLKVGCLFRT